MKTEISQEFFKKILIERLKAIDEKLKWADNALYLSEEWHDVWNNIRESNLMIEEIIDAIE